MNGVYLILCQNQRRLQFISTTDKGGATQPCRMGQIFGSTFDSDTYNTPLVEANQAILAWSLKKVVKSLSLKH